MTSLKDCHTNYHHCVSHRCVSPTNPKAHYSKDQLYKGLEMVELRLEFRLSDTDVADLWISGPPEQRALGIAEPNLYQLLPQTFTYD